MGTPRNPDMGIQEMPAGSDPNTPLRANNSPIEPVVYPGRHGKKVRALNIVNLYPRATCPGGPLMPLLGEMLPPAGVGGLLGVY